MHSASAVRHNDNVYVMAGETPQNDTLDYVFSYNIGINEWSRLPPPGHYKGILQILHDKLTVIGGRDNATNEFTNKVSTFNSNSSTWEKYFPSLLQPRSKPGVLTHEDYVIVLGGGIDDDNDHDDIEVLNLTQPLQWTKSNLKLPEPMWAISLTTSHGQLYIVGYTTSDGRYTKAYQIPVDSIVSSISSNHSPHSGQGVEWATLPRAPHYNTALLPHSCPPIIVGGDDIQDVPTSNIAILNIMENKWDRIASFHSARTCVAVVPISQESVLVIGGTTGGKGVSGAKANCVNAVEKGTVSINQTVDTEGSIYSICTIQ